MIQLLLQLFGTFFVIGMFTFGGGGAMISLIQAQVVSVHGWLTEEMFANIVAISQSTPGPIGINCATYTGYQVIVDNGYGGAIAVLGSLSTTIALVLPSLIIFYLIMLFYSKVSGSSVFRGVMDAMKPAVAGMMGAAALVLMFRIGFAGWVPQISLIRTNFHDWTSWALFVAAFSLGMWTKISPIWIIVGAGALGLLLY